MKAAKPFLPSSSRPRVFVGARPSIQVLVGRKDPELKGQHLVPCIGREVYAVDVVLDDAGDPFRIRRRSIEVRNAVGARAKARGGKG